MRIEASIFVNAAPQLVWDLATDPARSREWNPNIVEVREVGDAPVHVGSTWIQVVRILGKATNMRAEVLECDPPHLGVVRFHGPGNPQVATTISPEGTGSRLSQVMNLGEAPGFGALAVRLAGPTIHRELNEALARQKRAAEEEHGNAT